MTADPNRHFFLIVTFSPVPVSARSLSQRTRARRTRRSLQRVARGAEIQRRVPRQPPQAALHGRFIGRAGREQRQQRPPLTVVEARERSRRPQVPGQAAAIEGLEIFRRQRVHQLRQLADEAVVVAALRLEHPSETRR